MRQRRRERRLTPQISTPPIRTSVAPVQTANEDASVVDVLALGLLETSPLLIPVTQPHIRFLGWDTLFPGSNMGAVFHGNSHFRRDLRRAARQDFVRPLQLKESVKQAMVNDDASSLQSSWRVENDFDCMSQVFIQYGLDTITGQSFVRALSDLCGDTPYVFGSWIDIVGIRGKRLNHSWHQDSGLDQNTVMVGFPSADHFEGTGVFSHAFKLSHQLPPPTESGPRLWDETIFPVREDEIVRPHFSRGKEVMVYNDRDVFHSAPDIAFRDSIWRFM
jgi:hypothetical protein